MIRRNLLGKMLLAVFVWVCAFPLHAEDTSAPVLAAQGTLQAAFAPWDDIEEIIRTSIDQSQQQVYVQAYLLTNRKIAEALIAAKRRGVDVRVLADARRHAEMPSSRLAALASAGVGVWLETRYENAHNKVVIIDAATPHATVITGSFNFTWTAQHRNAENVLVVRNNPGLAAKYEMNWLRHQKAALALKK